MAPTDIVWLAIILAFLLYTIIAAGEDMRTK